MNPQGFLVLFRSTSDTIVAGMLLSLTFLKMVQLLKPYKDQELNRIKETSIWQIFFVFQIALLIKMNDVDGNFLTVCLLLAFFANFVILLGQCLVQYCERHVCVPLSVFRRHGGDAEKDVMEVEMKSSMASLVTAPGGLSSRNDDNTRSISDSSSDGPHASSGHARVDSNVTTSSPPVPAPSTGSSASSTDRDDDDSHDVNSLCSDTVEHTHSPFHPAAETLL